VFHHQEVQQVDRLASGGGKGDDMRISDGEGGQLPYEWRLNEEALLVLPELQVVREQLRQGKEEGPPHVHRPTRKGYALDTVHPVDDVEERLDVVLENLLANGIHYRLETISEQVDLAVAGRTHVHVKPPNHLRKGEGGDELAASHLLIPANTTVHGERLIRPGELEQNRYCGVLLSQVAEQDVRADTNAVLIQRLEPILLPHLICVEVDSRSDVRANALSHHSDTGADALQAVDDVGRVVEDDEALSFSLDGEVVSAHADFNIGNAGAVAQSLDEAVLLSLLVEDFPLVNIH